MPTPTVTDKHFREFEHWAFGFGYGTGEYYILPLLHAFLLHLENGRAYSAQTMADGLGAPVTWFLINTLCRTNILDYGTSSRHGWLTPQGERLRGYVISRTPEELYDVVTQDFDPEHPLCSRYFCNCSNGIDGQGCMNNPLFHETMRADVMR